MGFYFVRKEAIKINREIINDALWILYEDWLLKKINLDNRNGFRKSYSNLLIDLHFIKFTYKIEKDKNRAEDGIYLRNEFLASNQPETISMANPCSVLEMLVALSLRMGTEYIGTEETIDNIFISLLDNLYLLDFNNNHYYSLTSGKITNIVLSWLNRDFSPSGTGSIFPLKCDTIYDLSGIVGGKKYPDQRNIEIWEQMQCYINDKYKG